ncbi:MAG: hypothetical protein LQ347_000745 [Umbilicaria vellea]|nr:MAG: hypothetical protein LQ347_000745 [Umbilicaria vellea]
MPGPRTSGMAPATPKSCTRTQDPGIGHDAPGIILDAGAVAVIWLPVKFINPGF